MKNVMDMMPSAPEVKFTKSGYEIRTEVLGFAKDFILNEYNSKFNGWEICIERDPTTGQVLTKMDMPQFPGLDQILTTAERMYDFVNAGRKTTKSDK